MLNCPICGFDYGEVGLQGGRCRQCGSVIAWEDTDERPAPGIARTVPDIKPKLTAHLHAETIAQLNPVLPQEPSPPSVPERNLQEPPSPPVPPSKSKDPQDRVSDSAFKSVRQTDRPHSTEAVQPVPVAGPQKPQRKTAPLTPEEMRKVTAIWDTAHDPQLKPHMTIKVADKGTVSDLELIIQPRNVRRGTDDTPSFLADYELIETIGTGGMGVVFSARQSSIDRNVALKMLRSEMASDASLRNKFLSEAVVTGDLDHPNIVPIYDLGTDNNGSLFYSMKRVQGTPWSSVIKTKTLPENLSILMKVADAVAFAHSRGVVHRDLKPENAMLGEFGEVLLMDWGIALPTSSYKKSGGVLKSQGLGGTPAYMAPEMATGPLEKIGPASDIYLLGAILFEVITGEPPHEGQTVMSCVMSAARNEVRPTDKSGELLDIALRAMSTRPRDRHPSVRAFQDAIREYQSHSESVMLTDRADEDLNSAEVSDNYEDYSRTVFAYQESLAMWDRNVRAQSGLVRAKLAYADCALRKGDYDLGLSLLDATTPSHQSLYQKLTAARDERNARQTRLANGKRLVKLLIVAIIVGGASAIFVINEARQDAIGQRAFAQEAEAKAKADREEAVVAKEKAESEEQKAKAEQERAEKEKKRAEEASSLAKKEKQNADKERENAIAAKRAVEQESYFSEVSLVAENIAANAFDDARRTLVSHSNSVKSKLRHWEWGRLNFLCNGSQSGPQTVLTTELMAPVEAIALSHDEKHLAVAGADGSASVWNTETGKLEAGLAHGKTVEAIAFSPDGRLVATGGSRAEGGSIRIWELNDNEEARILKELPTQGTKVLSVAFSPDGQSVLSGANDKTVHLWNWREGTIRQSFLGHLDQVWSVAFSPKGNRVVTASLDSTVRIWSVTDGSELDRLRGHSGPVYCATFSPDGTRVVSGGYDKHIFIWDISSLEKSKKSIVDDVEQRVAGKNATAQPHQTLTGHQASVRSVGFSANGEFLVSAGQDNTVRIWDAGIRNNVTDLLKSLRADTTDDENSSRLLKTLRGHGGWVHSALLTKDGAWAYSGSYDQNWKKWDVARHEEIRVMQGHERPILASLFTPDGRRVITALDDGTVRIFDYSSGNQVGVLEEGHEFLTTSALFFPDGNQLLTAAGDNTVRVWDISHGVQRLDIAHAGRRGIAALSPDGSLILTGGDDKTAKLWRADTGEFLFALNRHKNALQEMQRRNPGVEFVTFQKQLPEITTVAISHDQSMLFTGDAFGKCWLWDAKTGQALRELYGHDFAVTAGSFLPPGKVQDEFGPLLLTASADNTVVQWNLNSGKERVAGRFNHPSTVTLLAVSENGERALTACTVRGKSPTERVVRVWLWDVATAKVIAFQDRVNESVNSVIFSRADGSEAIITSTSTESSRHFIWQWDLTNAASRELLVPYPHINAQHGTVSAAVPSPDGKRLATVGGKGARLWDTQSGKEITNLRPHGAVTHLAISSDGTLLATAGSEGTAKIWDLAANKPLRKLSGGHRKAIRSIAFSPNGEQIVTAGDDHFAVLWDTKSGEIVGEKEFCRHDAPIHIVLFTPDGSQVLTGGDDNHVRLWDLATRREDRKFTGHTAGVLSAAFSADGRWLLTGSEDKTARVWSVQDGRLLSVLTGHSAAVSSVKFSRDGLRAISGSHDNTAKIWNTRSLISLRDLCDDNEKLAEFEDLKTNEVLTLKHHEREVTSVSFSPNGQDVLTASRDGSAVIWLGDFVEPSVELSDGYMRYVANSGPLSIDPSAVLSYPSHCGLEGALLEVSLDGAANGKQEKLTIVRRGLRCGSIELRDNQLWFHAANDDAAQMIGEWASSNDERRLEFKFNASATDWALTALLRSVSFEYSASTPEEYAREVHCSLRTRSNDHKTVSKESRMIEIMLQ